MLSPLGLVISFRRDTWDHGFLFQVKLWLFFVTLFFFPPFFFFSSFSLDFCFKFPEQGVDVRDGAVVRKATFAEGDGLHSVRFEHDGDTR